MTTPQDTLTVAAPQEAGFSLTETLGGLGRWAAVGLATLSLTACGGPQLGGSNLNLGGGNGQYVGSGTFPVAVCVDSKEYGRNQPQGRTARDSVYGVQQDVYNANNATSQIGNVGRIFGNTGLGNTANSAGQALNGVSGILNAVGSVFNIFDSPRNNYNNGQSAFGYKGNVAGGPVCGTVNTPIVDAYTAFQAYNLYSMSGAVVATQGSGFLQKVQTGQGMVVVKHDSRNLVPDQSLMQGVPVGAEVTVSYASNGAGQVRCNNPQSCAPRGSGWGR